MSESEFRLNDQQKRALLEIARTVVEAAVTGSSWPKMEPPTDAALQEPCGCFVTLHISGQLRGCIGTFQASSPLYQTVSEMAKEALNDPRFLNQPVRADELSKLDIEISVLSPLERTDDPLSLELGKHGIYIKQGYQTGCFLPQVAQETGWNKQQFLSYCCSHKASLPADAWKDSRTEVYLFTAQVFSEKDFNP